MVNNVYLTELAKALSRAEIPDFSAGASGYFSEPQKILDPALFDSDERVKHGLGMSILHTLFQFWRSCGYRRIGDWATVWLAGSGISYQWAGDRGNGDLDVLIGIDWPSFYEHNPLFKYNSIDQITDYIDNELRLNLWPRTAHTEIGGKSFEVTFFVNQDASDIRNIHPYVAYNLTTDEWTIKPPKHTAFEEDPGTPIWRTYAERELATAQIIRETIERTMATLPAEGTAQWVNAMGLISRQIATAIELIGSIHGQRRNAFRQGGKGYWDYSNWQWQMAKKTGIVTVLGALERVHREATYAVETALYGTMLNGADQLVKRSVLQNLYGR